MRSTTLVMLAALAWLVLTPAVRAQVSLPQVNLGLTNFQDGIAFPGWLIEETPGYYHATEWKDSQGRQFAGSNKADVFSSLTHVAYVSKYHLLGGYAAFEFLLPVAHVNLNTTFGPNYRTGGAADVILGPVAIEWTGTKLHGRPFFQRALLDVTVPTGQYSDKQPVNVGNHLVSINPYYAFTYFASNRLEISARLHYLWNSKNNDPFVGFQVKSIQPGQAFHQNFAASYGLRRNVRVGLNGYALEQITDHRFNGLPLPNSRERTFAVGPGLLVQPGKTVFLYFNAYFEAGVQNRPQGTAFVFRFAKFIGKLPPGN